MKIRLLGNKLLHVDSWAGDLPDRQTDTKKLMVAFRNFGTHLNTLK